MQEIWQKKLWLIVMAVVWAVLAAGCEGDAQQAQLADLTEFYNLSLPAGDWRQQGTNIWAPVREQEVLTDVRIWLVRLEDCTQEAAEKQLQDEGYAELSEKPGYWQKQADALQYQTRLVVEKQNCWLVCSCWPEEDNVWAEQLAAALASFELVQE